MKIISIANHKGGTGKTSIAWNIACLLAEKYDVRVLAIDIDPQSSLTEAVLGSGEYANIGDVLGDNEPGELSIRDVIVSISDTLSLIPSDISLANNELGLIMRTGRENILKRALSSVRNEFDFVLIDCPPSLNLLVLNALNSSDGVLIPTRAEPTDLRGTRLFLQSVQEIRQNPDLNPDLTVLAVIPTMVSGRLRLHQAALEDLSASGVPVWDTVGQTVKIGEGMINGTPLHRYQPNNPQVKALNGIASKVNQWLKS